MYTNYESVNIKELIEEKFTTWKRDNEKKISVNKGLTDTINLKLGEGKHEKYPVKKEKIKDIRIEIHVVEYLEAPVKKDQVVGKIRLELDNNVIEEIDIKVSEKVEKKNVFDYFWNFFLNYDIIKTVVKYE